VFIKPTSLSVAQLLGGQSEQYVIPAYQRRYSWQEKQLTELIEDIELLEHNDSHLLGSIVCLVGPYRAGLNHLELVDGQQRVTTLNILLHCILERLRYEGATVQSQATSVEAMLQSHALGARPVRKIALDSIDADEFEQHVGNQEILQPRNPNLDFAFKFYREWAQQLSLEKLVVFLYRLTNQATVIRLDVADAKDAFKLFETINNRGLRLSATDIIKNFVLGNAARFGEPALEQARLRWAEVISHLDGANFENFFRHYLAATLKRRVTSAYVVSYFKSVFMDRVSEAASLPERHWYADDSVLGDEAESIGDEADDETPVSTAREVAPSEMPKVSFSEFLRDLTHFAKVFGQIVTANTGVPTIDRRLRNLRMIKSVQTYGFLMALRAGGCKDSTFAEVLRLTEAFMLRRHICRERANENESMFARLCGVDPADPLPRVKEEFRALSPSDDAFETSFATFEFSASVIERARYCLERFEQEEHGSFDELAVTGTDLVHVEHIIPQKIKTKRAVEEHGDWVSYLGDKALAKHPHYVCRLGNLTLFAGTLNIGASNHPYQRKTQAYLQSGLKMTRALPADYPEFNFDAVDQRSSKLARKAVALWPIAAP